MRRTVLALTAVGFLLLVPAPDAPEVRANGEAPTCTDPAVCPTPKTTGPAVSGVMVVDIHREDVVCQADVNLPGITCVQGAGVTGGPKAKYASIRLKKGTANAAAIFRLPIFFGTSSGCDVGLAAPRFLVHGGKPLNNGLRRWIRPAIVDRLLRDLGIDPATSGEPVITDLENVVCTGDPENFGAGDSDGAPLGTPLGTLLDGSKAGIQSMDVVIQFVK